MKNLSIPADEAKYYKPGALARMDYEAGRLKENGFEIIDFGQGVLCASRGVKDGYLVVSNCGWTVDGWNYGLYTSEEVFQSCGYPLDYAGGYYSVNQLLKFVKIFWEKE